jgi:hypothetical protein
MVDVTENPFMTRADWKKEKTKYGIPDKVIKSGSFGEKMEGYHKKFDSAGFSNITTAKVAGALDLVKEANKTFDDWLGGADKLKPEAFKGDKANKAKAIDRVKMYKKWVQNLENQVKTTKDPFVSARVNYSKCLAYMQAAMAHPDNSAALQKLYSQGIRNDLGAPFHAALTTYKGDPEVLTLLTEYEALAKKWNSTMQGGGPATVAANPVQRAKLLSDMQEAMRIGVRILGVTKPK